MIMLNSLSRKALESAILLRQRLDFRAAQSLANLHGKVVQIESPSFSGCVEFQNGSAVVRDGAAESADLTISGPMLDVLQALMFGNTSGVQMDGDETLAPMLEQVFVPPMLSSEFGSKIRPVVEAASATVADSVQSMQKLDGESARKLLDELVSKIESVAQRVLDAEADISKLKKRAGLNGKK